MINLPSLKKLVKTSRAAWLFLVLAVFFLFFIFSPARAAVQTSQQEFERAVTSEAYNKQSFDLQTLSGIINSANVAILGCITPELQDQCQQQLGGSAINTTGAMIAALYANPPASGVQYLADVSSRFGIVKPVYAQAGTGFRALSPILPIWRAFRNLAYLAFVIIFVIMGFAIMFRIKISPQAVITIQSALPRIVIALILVTFSYAIAGLLIDLIYVLISVSIALFSPFFTQPGEIEQLQQRFISGGFPHVIASVFQVPGAEMVFWLAAVGGLVGAAIGGLVSGITAGTSILVGFGVGIALVLLIIALIILYILFKLFLELLKAYIGIILAVIFAPLQILLGVIPGQTGFGGWLRGLLANILVFPAVAVVLLLARVLVQKAAGPGALWSPPMLGGGALIQEAVPALIGLGMLLVIYKVPEMIKKALGVEPFPFGAAIAEPLRFGATPVRIPTQVSWAGIQKGAADWVGRTAPGIAGGITMRGRRGTAPGGGPAGSRP